MKMFIAAFIFAGFFAFVIYTWATTPIVQYSWSTRECVRVIGGEGWSCENLPSKYEKEWTE